MRVFTVKLSDEERGHLEALRARWGLRSEAEVVRKMIREAADRAGLAGNVEPGPSWNGMPVARQGKVETVLLSTPPGAKLVDPAKPMKGK